MKKALAAFTLFLLLALILAGCGGGGGESKTQNQPTSAPLAPTDFSASVNGNQLTLSWKAVAGATSYNCYYSSTPGVSKASSHTNFSGLPPYEANQTLTISFPLDPGTYYAVLTAVNSLGESPVSWPERMVTITDPGPGPGPTLTPFNGQSVTTFSGTGSMGFADGPPNSARYLAPRGLVTNGSYLYVADSGNNVIRAVAVATGQAYTLAGNVNGYSGSSDGDGFGARFGGPSGVALVGGYLYVADTANSTIRRVLLTPPYTVTTIAGSASAYGSTDGTLSGARFKYPRGIAGIGNTLYVADTGNNTIRKLDLTSNLVTTLAGNANAYAGDATGAGTTARFNFPYGITVDPSGSDLYLCDQNNGKIKKLHLASNVVSTVSDAVSKPTGVVTDGDMLLVADAGTVGTGATANAVAQIDAVSGVTQLLAGNGDPLGMSTDGVGSAATFNHPEGIALWGTDLYISDTLSHELRKIE